MILWTNSVLIVLKSQDTLFALYPPQDDEDIIERRCQPDMPIEHLGHRILVKCTQLQYKKTKKRKKTKQDHLLLYKILTNFSY